MTTLFAFTGHRVGVNVLRSSYLTYQAEQKRLSVKDKKKLAILLRIRKDKIHNNYINILPQADEQIILNEMAEPEINLKPTLSPYQKQKINNKSYYQKNKQNIINRLKEHNKKIPKERKNKERILHYLNGNETYQNMTKQNTIKKYKIQYVFGLWVQWKI